MLSQAEIKKLRSLREKKFRDECSLFVVEGDKLVQEALQSGWDVEKIYRTEEIGAEAMSRISMLSSPSPSLAVVRQKKDAFIPGQDLPSGLYLALDCIRDPGNLGTILRIADWFGIRAVFASPDSVELYNPKVVQSTMGSVFRVEFHRCDIPALCSGVISSGGSVLGTFLDGEDIYKADIAPGNVSLIVIGNEANGISEAVEKLVSKRLTIPSYSLSCGPESLNAAVATAVAVSELKRRGF